MEECLLQVLQLFLLIRKLFFPLFWLETSNSVFSHELQRSMHQKDADKCRNFPVHNAMAVVASWAVLQLSSVQAELGISAQTRNHRSTTGICVWLLILCCLWICTKRRAGITADSDDRVDLLALGVGWLCLGGPDRKPPPGMAPAVTPFGRRRRGLGNGGLGMVMS